MRKQFGFDPTRTRFASTSTAHDAAARVMRAVSIARTRASRSNHSVSTVGRSRTRSRDVRRRATTRETPLTVTRREALLTTTTTTTLVGALVGSRASANEETDDDVADARRPRALRVGDGPGEYATVNAALADAKPGDVVRVRDGATLDERIVVDVDDVTIECERRGGTFTLRHFTETPYESVIEIRSRGASVRDVACEHSSKSVANNYGLFVVEGASATFERVRVRSKTGSGFGVEGARVTMTECDGSACASHGLVCLGDSSGMPASGAVIATACVFDKNGGNGALVRGGAMIEMDGCSFSDNGRYGLELIDCEGALRRSSAERNRKGAYSASNGAERFVDLGNLA